MTSEPADYFGIKDRGRLIPGLAADTIIFDPATIGTPLRPDQVRHDLPSGGRRLYASVTGMEFIIVNGEIVYDHGKPTGAMPGQIVDGR
jgi:N-acyl-D-aspartate/D-glutamate deacylase